MKHATAVGHLHKLTEALDAEARFAHAVDAQPVVLEAYAFGAVLDGTNPLERTEVAFVVDRTDDELPWGVDPPEVLTLLERHRLAKLPLRWLCRPSDLPVANHRVVRPLRFWALDGADEVALSAIAARRADALRPAAPDPAELAGQLEREAEVALAGLDRLVQGFRGDPRTVADELFELAWGYTDLRRGLAELRGEATGSTGASGVDEAAQTPAWTLDRYQALRGAGRQGHGATIIGLLGADAPLDEVAQLAGDGLLVALAQDVAGAREATERCLAALRARDWEGDEELAAALEAALGTGPVQTLRQVPVDLDELASHLESGGSPYDLGMRLEVATGALWPDLGEDETGEPLPDDWDDPDAWMFVEPQGSQDAYHDMERFASTVSDRQLADRLARALEGRGAFRRFREVLDGHEAEQSRWRVFSDERARGRARSWLAVRGYRPS